MDRSSLSRLIPIILIIIIAIVVISALIALGRAIFLGNVPSDQAINSGRSALLDTAIDRSVRMNVRGPIVADEDFHSYQIAVTPTSRTLTTYVGYLNRTLDTTALSNTTPAYEQFVYALDKANLTKGTPLTGDMDDTRGICATGNVVEFEIRRAQEVVEHLWTSTCSGSKGSLDASVTQLQNLFIRQIPNAKALINKIELSQAVLPYV